MSAITREQLRERARAKVKSLEFSITQTAFADSRAELEEELELARIALASLEAEPVHQVLNGDAWVDLSKGAMDSQKRVGAIVRTVYTAPPAPVSVPDEMTPKQASRAYCGEVRGYRDGWNACRAAMLQSFGNSEQLNSPVIPDGWVMVPVEPTPDMREAYHQAQAEYEDVDGLWSPDHQWQAMLAAAPQQEVK